MADMTEDPVGQQGFVKTAIKKTQRTGLAKKVGAKAPVPANSKQNPALMAAIDRRLAAGGKQ